MKKIFFALMALITGFCAYGVILPEGTDARINDIEMNDDGEIIRVYLSEPQQINTPIGKILAKDGVGFNSEGKVIQFTPCNDGVIEGKGISYKKGEIISFYDSGCVKSIFISDRYTVITTDDGTFSCRKGRTEFYDGWMPKSVYVDDDSTIVLKCGNVSCNGDFKVSFHPNGRVESVWLVRDAHLITKNGDFTACSGGRLDLYDDGTVKYAKVLNSQGISTKYGKVFPAENTEITFYKDGTVENVVPADIMLVQYNGKNYMATANCLMRFYEDGEINAFTVNSRKIKFNSWTVEGESDKNPMVIYPDGKIYLPAIKAVTVAGKDYTFTIQKISGGDDYYDRYKFVKKLVITDNACYCWNHRLDDNYSNRNNTISIVTQNGSISAVKTAKYSTVSNISGDNFDDYNHCKDDAPDEMFSGQYGNFDFEDCPLIFDEEDNLIGYRKATTDEDYVDEISDEHAACYNYNLEEYRNYIGDEYFEDIDDEDDEFGY